MNEWENQDYYEGDEYEGDEDNDFDYVDDDSELDFGDDDSELDYEEPDYDSFEEPDCDSFEEPEDDNEPEDYAVYDEDGQAEDYAVYDEDNDEGYTEESNQGHAEQSKTVEDVLAEFEKFYASGGPSIADFEKNKHVMPNYVKEDIANPKLAKCIKFLVYTSMRAIDENKDGTKTVYIPGTDYTTQAFMGSAGQAHCSVAKDTELFEAIMQNLGIVGTTESTCVVTCKCCGEKFTYPNKFEEGYNYHECKDAHVKMNRDGDVVCKVDPRCLYCKNIVSATTDLCEECTAKKKAVDMFFDYLNWFYHYAKEQDANLKLGETSCYITDAIAKEVKENIVDQLIGIYKFYATNIEEPCGVLAVKHIEIEGTHVPSVVSLKVENGKFGTKLVSAPTSGSDILLSHYNNIVVDAYRQNYKNNDRDINETVLGDPEILSLNLKNPKNGGNIGFAGFHLPHIYGYFRMNGVFQHANLMYDTKPEKGDFKDQYFCNDAKAALFEEILAEAKEYIYANRGTIMITPNMTLENVYTACKKAYKAVRVKEKVPAVVQRTVLSAGVTASLLDIQTRIKNFTVVRKMTDFEVFYDISGAYKATTAGSQHPVGEAVKTVLTKRLNDFDANTIEGNHEGMGNQTAIMGYADISNVPELAVSIYSIAVMLDPVKKYALPKFAYEPVKKLLNAGLFSANEMILGETVDGDYVKVNGIVEDHKTVAVYATSRAGKGVLTLALLGSILSTPGVILTYADCKPEMSVTVLKLEDMFAKFIKNRRVHILSNEYQLCYTDKDSASYGTEVKGMTEYMRKELWERQRNWRKDSDGRALVKQFAERFWVPVNLPSKAITWLLYNRHVMLMLVLFDRIGSPKMCSILDELNTFEFSEAIWGSFFKAKIDDALIPDEYCVDPDASKADRAAAETKLKAYKAKKEREFKAWIAAQIGERNKDGGVTPTNTLITASNYGRNGKGFAEQGRKLGACNPAWVLIGQDYARSVSLHIDPTTGTYNYKQGSGEYWGSCLLNNAHYRIQGNWSKPDAMAHKKAKGVEGSNTGFAHPVLTALGVGTPEESIEVSSGLIHAGIQGYSGFFAMQDIKQGTTRVFNSYFVLPDNTYNYTDRTENSVRARAKSGLNAESITDYCTADDIISAKLYEDFDRIKADRENALCGKTANEDPTISHGGKLDAAGFKRRKACGFVGYIEMIAGVDFSGDCVDPATQQAATAFVDNIANGYDTMVKAFKELAICKVFQSIRGWRDDYLLEDFLYDLDIDLFVTMEALAETDVDKFLDMIGRQDLKGASATVEVEGDYEAESIEDVQVAPVPDFGVDNEQSATPDFSTDTKNDIDWAAFKKELKEFHAGIVGLTNTLRRNYTPDNIKQRQNVVLLLTKCRGILQKIKSIQQDIETQFCEITEEVCTKVGIPDMSDTVADLNDAIKQWNDVVKNGGN